MTGRNGEKRRRYLKEYNSTHAVQRRRIHHRAEWKALGLDVDECEQIYDSKVACDICGIPFLGDRQKSLDHDHKTGRVRGVLCTNCNLALGLMKDDPRLLRRALIYLKLSREDSSKLPKS